MNTKTSTPQEFVWETKLSGAIVWCSVTCFQGLYEIYY